MDEMTDVFFKVAMLFVGVTVPALVLFAFGVPEFAIFLILSPLVAAFVFTTPFFKGY